MIKSILLFAMIFGMDVYGSEKLEPKKVVVSVECLKGKEQKQYDSVGLTKNDAAALLMGDISKIAVHYRGSRNEERTYKDAEGNLKQVKMERPLLYGSVLSGTNFSIVQGEQRVIIRGKDYDFFFGVNKQLFERMQRKYDEAHENIIQLNESSSEKV